MANRESAARNDTDDIPTGSHVCRCGETFQSEADLEDHARTEHGAMEADEVESFTCDVCSTVLGSAADLAAHQSAHAHKS